MKIGEKEKVLGVKSIRELREEADFHTTKVDASMRGGVPSVPSLLVPSYINELESNIKGLEALNSKLSFALKELQSVIKKK